MKKGILFLAMFLAAGVFSGCESTQTVVETQVTAQATTAAPVTAEQTTEATTAEAVTVGTTEALVEMQTAAQDNSIKNVVGVQTPTGLSTIIVNQTGATISEFYVRVHPQYDDEDDDDDSWGDDLIHTSFTLPNGERMLYYFAGRGSGTTMYDLRICYTDENLSECYFRNIPLETITQIVLRMDGVDEDAIPYATYMIANGQKEYSTLNDVKRRIGLLDEDEEEETSESPTPTPVETTTEATTQPTTAEPNDWVSDTGEISGDSNAQTADMQTAESFIGQSLSDLESTLGSDNGSEYDTQEGRAVGYHYYENYTVYTQVDDYGNETVIGVY